MRNLKQRVYYSNELGFGILVSWDLIFFGWAAIEVSKDKDRITRNACCFFDDQKLSDPSFVGSYEICMGKRLFFMENPKQKL